MSIKINYNNTKVKASNNLILFSDDNFNINHLKKDISKSEFNYITDLLKTSDLKKKFLTFEINSKKKIILVSIKKNLKIADIEAVGAELFSAINQKKITEYLIVSDSLKSNYDNILGHFLHGIKLKSYEFKKYKSKKK